MLKYLIPVFLVLVVACNKDVLNTVPNNNAPNDPTISNSTKNNYINKLYIKLLDRKADSVEFASALALLNQAPGTQSKRKQVVELIKNNPEYHHVLFKHIRELLLDATDTASIRKEYDDLVDDWNNAPPAQKPAYEYEWKRLEFLLNAADKLANGTYTWQELQKYACNNIIYDDINMGSENFVVSIFQNLIQRYPTLQELTEGKKMVNGTQGVLFLQVGETKNEFLDIFFSVNSYYEGQVTYLFRSNVFRSPTSQEQTYYTQYFLSDKDFDNLYVELLSSDIYFEI